jgi:hypothetical protein
MNDSDLGATLSPEENSYFESGGNSEIPGGGGTTTTNDQASGGGGTGAAADAGTPGADGKTPDKQLTVEKMVSLSALHEERGRRKATETEKRALETQLAELRGKFSIIERLQQPAQPEAPTVENDIFGVVKNLSETQAQILQRQKADDAQRAADGERNNLVNTYRMDAAQFEAKTPDYRAAYNHLINSRAAELQAMGYEDPVALQQAVEDDELAIARMALSAKKSPAQIIYSLAQQRGYKKAGGGQDPGKGADKLDTINRGQQANKSLSSTGGNAGDGEVTGEMLLKMPMDEFETWCAKNPAKAKRLMGG